MFHNVCFAQFCTILAVGCIMLVSCNSYKTLTGMQKMHGRMHPNHSYVSCPLNHFYLDSQCPVMSDTHPIAGSLPVARQCSRNVAE